MPCTIGYLGFDVTIQSNSSGTLTFTLNGYTGHSFSVAWSDCFQEDPSTWTTAPDQSASGWLYISRSVATAMRCANHSTEAPADVQRPRELNSTGYRGFWSVVVSRSGDTVEFSVDGEPSNITIDWTNYCKAWPHHPDAMQDPQVNDEGTVLFGPDAGLTYYTNGDKYPGTLAGFGDLEVDVRITRWKHGRAEVAILRHGQELASHTGATRHRLPVGHGAYLALNEPLRSQPAPFYEGRLLERVGLTHLAIARLGLVLPADAA